MSTDMQQQLFFAGDDPVAAQAGQAQLRHDLLRKAIGQPLPEISDLQLCDALVQLARAELTAFGTGMTHRISDSDARLLLRACTAICRRVNITFPDLPFRDLTGFREYWISQEMAGSYPKRRRYIELAFEPVEEEILSRSAACWQDQLIGPASPHSGTGWEVIDAEILELRQRFANARTAQDHCAVGAACVRILEHLGEVAFDPAKHLRDGATCPPRSNTKDRFEAVIALALDESEHHKMRKLARSIIDVAQDVKHSKTPSRRDAGIAADSVIMLVNVIRRLTLTDDRVK